MQGLPAPPARFGATFTCCGVGQQLASPLFQSPCLYNQDKNNTSVSDQAE